MKRTALIAFFAAVQALTAAELTTSATTNPSPVSAKLSTPISTTNHFAASNQVVASNLVQNKPKPPPPAEKTVLNLIPVVQPVLPRVHSNTFLAVSAAAVGGAAFIASIYMQDWVNNAPGGTYRTYLEFNPNIPAQGAALQARYPGRNNKDILDALYAGYVTDNAVALGLRWGGLALFGTGVVLYLTGLNLQATPVAVLPMRDGFALNYQQGF